MRYFAERSRHYFYSICLFGTWLTFCSAISFGAPVTSSVGVGGSHPNIYVDHTTNAALTNGLGYWIWDHVTLDKQTVQIWKDFQVPNADPVRHAELRVAADNAYRVWIDGKEIGSGSDWRTLSIYDLSGTLNPGTHVLAVEGFNDAEKAGIIAGLRLTLADGQTV